MITGLTRGGAEWTPQFATELDQSRCIGCGRLSEELLHLRPGLMATAVPDPALGDAVCAALRGEAVLARYPG